MADPAGHDGKKKAGAAAQEQHHGQHPPTPKGNCASDEDSGEPRKEEESKGRDAQVQGQGEEPRRAASKCGKDEIRDRLEHKVHVTVLPALSLPESNPPVRGQRASNLRLRTKTDQVAHERHVNRKLVVLGYAGLAVRCFLQNQKRVGVAAPTEKDWEPEPVKAQGPDEVFQENRQAGNGADGRLACIRLQKISPLHRGSKVSRCSGERIDSPWVYLAVRIHQDDHLGRISGEREDPGRDRPGLSALAVILHLDHLGASRPHHGSCRISAVVSDDQDAVPWSKPGPNGLDRVTNHQLLVLGANQHGAAGPRGAFREGMAASWKQGREAFHKDDQDRHENGDRDQEGNESWGRHWRFSLSVTSR